MSRKLFTLLIVLLVFMLSATGALAQDQVLRIATGSSGVANFSFQILSAGGDQQNWITFQSVPPLYFDVDFNLNTGYFNAWIPTMTPPSGPSRWIRTRAGRTAHR